VKKPAKRKPAPKPVECWCALYDGKIAPGWCCETKDIAMMWAAGNPGGAVIRVRIVPVAAKRRKGGK